MASVIPWFGSRVTAASLIGAAALMLLIPAASVGVSSEPSPPVSCSTILLDGRLMDCVEERDVDMQFIMVLGGNSREECQAEPRSCDQEFIVFCENYWSDEYQTSHAILKVEATTPESRIAMDEISGAGGFATLHVRRDYHCDSTPFEGGFGTDCDEWNCFPECCRIFSHYKYVSDGAEVLLEDLEEFGALPCFVLDQTTFGKDGLNSRNQESPITDESTLYP
jgi:hypothetical protein